jgi:general stress protein CsbA
MDLAWIWTAFAAVAAVLSSIWSVAQTLRMRSPFGRYEQWIRVRDDQLEESSVRAYAESRANDALVDLATRGRLTKIRRNQWIAIVLILVFIAPFLLLSTASRDSSGWLGMVIAVPIAAVMIVADWRLTKARTQARRDLFSVGSDASREKGRLATARAKRAAPGTS